MIVFLQDKIINIVIAVVTAIFVLVSHFLLHIMSLITRGLGPWPGVFIDHSCHGNSLQPVSPPQVCESVQQGAEILCVFC